MEQEVALEQAVEQPIAEEDEALTVCKSCNHLVPKTMVCLYCGTPILFKEPKSRGK